MGLLSRVARDMVQQMGPQDAALMMIKERAPEVYKFMRFGSATEENPMNIAYELRRGIHPDVLLEMLRDRSRRAHLNSFIKDGYEPPI